MNIIERRLDSIRPYENNPRRNEKAVDAVAASIREFGFKVPIVIDADGVIVAGHTRAKAAEKLGLKSVPCIVADDLTEEQLRAFRLADNKTAELAEWDFEKLELEMMEIKTIPLEPFGFGGNSLNEWFDRENRNDDSRKEGNDEYNEFLDKFEDPKTTDDCYTPDNIYDAVADWTAKEYGLNRRNFVRPFYPGGDFEAVKYKPTDIVVDNPPFSILAKIYDFYIEHGVKFLLFAPCMTSLKTAVSRGLCVIYDDCDILYENGATVPTAFTTNMDKGTAVRTAPELGAAVREANAVNRAAQSKSLPKYKYPNEVCTGGQMSYIGRYGIPLKIALADVKTIGELDSMKEVGAPSIFGGGLLLSEKAAAEKAAAEKAAAEKAAAEKAAATCWQLSEREWAIIHSLGGGENE